MKTPHLHSLMALVLCGSIFSAEIPLAQAEDKADDSYLDMGLAQLMQVTLTSVAKKEQSLDETAAAAFVISQSDIQQSGATSIPELLAMVPGIQVAQISASKWSVSSRGFSGYTSNKLLVMIDGRSVYTPAFSGTYWDMQNVMLEDVDRIEVIRGPGGTMWGANAVNGVINVITKKSQDTLGTLVRGSAGNQEQTAATRFGTPIGSKSFGRVYAMASDHDSNSRHDGSGDANDDWNNIQAGFRLDGITDANNDWTLSGDVYRDSGDQTVYPFWTNFPIFLTESRSSFRAEGANLIGSWQHRFTDDDQLTAKAYIDTTNRFEIFTDQSFTSLDLDIQYETRIGDRNSLTMGLGYRYIDGDFNETFQAAIPDQENSLYSTFIQDEVEIIPDNLWLTVGTKYEHNDFTGSEWQPSGRLLWKPRENHSLWTSVARAVRTPSMVEDSGSVTTGSFPVFIPPGTFTTGRVLLTGSSDFDSEEVIAYEAGYRWQASNSLFFDVALYYNEYDKIYSSLPIDSPTSLKFVNASEGEGYGFELAANWLPISWLSFDLAYSWQKIRLNWRNESFDIFPERQLSELNVPQNQISLRSKIVMSEQWQFNWWLRYVDEIVTLNPITLSSTIEVDSFVQLNANIIWKPIDNLEIMLAGRNFFNDEQLQFISEFITPATDIEADVYLKATWRF